VIARLREFYGLQPTPPADLFQFIVWEIVSDGALPARRDLAWQALRRIPALTPDAMFRAPGKDLLDAVGLAGPHRDEKMDRIRTTVGEFRRHREALHAAARVRLLPAARALRRLTDVPAAVRRRALLFACGCAVLPVDVEIGRVVERLMGTIGNRRRAPVRQWLERRLPRDLTTYREAVVYLRHHAQHTCTRVAPHCSVCPLLAECAYGLSSATRPAGEAP
jgi:endonuclease III